MVIVDCALLSPRTQSDTRHRQFVEMAERHLHIFDGTMGKTRYGVHCMIHLALRIDGGNPVFCDWRNARADIPNFLIQ